MFNRKLLIPIAIILLAGCVAVGYLLLKEPPEVDDTPYTPVVSSEQNEWSSTITVDGLKWRLNRDLETVLLLGIDSSERVVANELIGNGGRADVIMLLVLDNSQKTIQLLEISRDTMIAVDAYDDDREFLFSAEMQINMQYAFSDSPARSCQLMKRKVSELLYNVPVREAASVTTDGIAAAVGALGGITVTMEEDWSEIDPAYTAGAVVTMDGERMERFLRYRDISVTGTNDLRMARQRWLLRQLLPRLMDGQNMEKVLDAVAPYLETDLSADTLQKLRTYTQAEEAIKLPGKTVKGELHDEYYLDEAALRELVLRLFYVLAV